MRSSILGLMIASSIAVGLANADESNQNESRWTGFYVGANGGLARSDSKEALAFGAQGSSVGGSQNAGSNAFSSDPTSHDLQSGSLGMASESEISKALGRPIALSNGRLTSKLAIGLFAAIAIDTLLQLAWKTTVLETAADASPLATLGSVFANPAFFGVLFLMAIQFFNWLIVLSQADLSYVKPISSLSYASVPVFSALALGEAVDGVEITGLMCVIAGVWLISQTQPLTPKSS
jgi:uncharacterized membrane protein